MSGRSILLALILISVTASIGQRTANSHITVKTVDQSGATIPGAQIEIRTSNGETVTLIKADADGDADVDLGRGNYQFVVSYPAFCPYKQTLELHDRSVTNIRAVLNVESCPGPCRAACIDVQPTQPSAPVLKVTVVDPSGAFIPGAVIQLRSDLDVRVGEFRADENGMAELKLAPTKYSIRVYAPGFEAWSTSVNLTSGVNQSVIARLRPGRIMNSPVVEDNSLRPQVEASLLDVQLPSISLKQLSLPARKLRSHWPH